MPDKRILLSLAEATKIPAAQLPQLLRDAGLLMTHILGFGPPPPIAKLVVDRAIPFPMGVLFESVSTQISPRMWVYGKNRNGR